MLYTVQLLILSFAVTAEIESNNALRIKRAPEEKFRTLLRLYQMNPLKQSSIYKRLFNRLMHTHKKSEVKYDGAMNFDSNECTREKQRVVNVKLGHIEKVIHEKHMPVRHEDPAYNSYNVTNVGIEDFNSERFLHHNKLRNHVSMETEEELVKISPNVDLLFEHVGVDTEEDYKVILRKIRPANRTINNKLVFSNITGENPMMDKVVKTFPREPIAANFVQYEMMGNYPDIEAIVLK